MFKSRLGLAIVFALLVGGCEGDWQDLECKHPICSNQCVEYGIGLRGWCESFDFDPYEGTELAPWSRMVCVCDLD